MTVLLPTITFFFLTRHRPRLVVGLYAFFPAVAYNFNQHVEEHAYQTYTEYIDANAEYLKTQPAPQIALDYYTNDVLYLNPQPDSLEATQTPTEHTIPEVVRPVAITSLHDVFVHIRADEAQHARTMKSLQTRTSLLSRGKPSS